MWIIKANVILIFFFLNLDSLNFLLYSLFTAMAIKVSTDIFKNNFPRMNLMITLIHKSQKAFILESIFAEIFV